MERRNEIVEVSFDFALDIIEYSEVLEENKKYILSRQILKAGTSIGANVRESQKAESKLDFIHKLKQDAIIKCQGTLGIATAGKNHKTNPVIFSFLDKVFDHFFDHVKTVITFSI